jgi:hypothetical protein
MEFRQGCRALKRAGWTSSGAGGRRGNSGPDPVQALDYRQTLGDTENNFDRGKAGNNDAGAVHDRIDLPSREQKSGRRIVAATLQLRSANPQDGPHDHDRAGQVTAQRPGFSLGEIGDSLPELWPYGGLPQ